MKTIKLINSIDRYVFSSLHLIYLCLVYLTKTEIFRENYKSAVASVIVFI
jgi:hypothetical protein